MAQFDTRYATSGYPARTGAAVDEGLRSYMLGVYNYMAAGVALTGVTAYLTSMMAVGADGQLTQFGVALYNSPLKWVVMLAPLGFVLFLSFRVEKMSVGAAQAPSGCSPPSWACRCRRSSWSSPASRSRRSSS